MTRVFKLFILWVVKTCPRYQIQNIIDSDGTPRMRRYAPFWHDEWTDSDGQHHQRPPWYRPFNLLVHRWLGSQEEQMHDHPRWSITICLRGRLIEHTPWGSTVLTPGSMAFRSRKAIHSLEVCKGYEGKAWTVFIVGRRNHLQNYYSIKGYDREF